MIHLTSDFTSVYNTTLPPVGYSISVVITKFNISGNKYTVTFNGILIDLMELAIYNPSPFVMLCVNDILIWGEMMFDLYTVYH